MNILVIGSGGREHALIWKIKQSPLAQKVYCAPGNGGIARDAECVNIKVENIPALLKFAQDQKIDLTVVGPEIPLVMGIVNEFEKAGLKIFGPTQAAARLEGSKIFSKEFMRRYAIPTAEFQVFSDARSARHVLKVTPQSDFPIVVKADGLAAGKGVVICQNLAEVEMALSDMLEKKTFGEAGARVVVEDGLQGEELSVLALCDGQDFLILEPAQDHKRIFDNDQGPNTGGMGAYSPVPTVNSQLLEEVGNKVFAPALRGMAKEGCPFKGILYAGLMLTTDGLKVLEFNVRFGDPETQAVLPRLQSDLVTLLLAACDGKLAGQHVVWDKRTAVCVVMSSGGYPGAYESGREIQGLNNLNHAGEGMVFHAGTKLVNDKLVTAGGRVLGVTALGTDTQAAITKAYALVNRISFENCHFRKDIGFRAVRK